MQGNRGDNNDKIYILKIIFYIISIIILICVAVVLKEDGSVWWWGELNTGVILTGSEMSGLRFQKPTKVLEDVKMVWFESMEFNYSQTENIQFIPDEKYKIEYDFTTFVEKKDKSIWACGMNVSGKDSEIRKIDAYGDVLCSPSFVQINMEHL